MDDAHRRLLARATWAEEDAALCRERIAAAYREIAEVRAMVPAKVRQVDFSAPASDPIARLFAAIAPKKGKA